jgi:hypothetical protein
MARLEMSTNSDKARAELLFKKEQRLRDGQMAAAAYEAEQQAVQQKTARLRALRMARDAAENNKRKSSEMDSEQTEGAIAVRAGRQRKNGCLATAKN